MLTDAHRHSSITVQWALQQPALRRGVPEVLAGGRNLDRGIRWVHTGEIRHISYYLKGGELLLTAGYGIGKTASDQSALIAELAERGVAGFVVQLGEVFTRLPAPLINESERCGLPLIALHEPTPFVEVTEEMHREIISRQFSLLRRGEDLHHKFVDLTLDGAGVPEIIDALAEEIANPVVVARATDDVIYHATHALPQPDVVAAWHAFSRQLPGAPQAIEQHIDFGRGERWGRVVALGLLSALTDFDSVAVDRATSLVALSLRQSRDEEFLVIRERGDFLLGLTHGDIDEVYAASQASKLGFTASMFVPVAVRRSSEASAAAQDSRWRALWKDLSGELSDRRTQALISTREAGEALIVLGIPSTESRQDAADRLAELVRTLGERRVGVRSAATICVGPTVSTWGGLRDGLRVTRDALGAAAGARQPRPWHDVTVPNIDRLLWALRDQRDLQDFVRTRLSGIIAHDRDRKVKLMPTLIALCEHGGRKAETARVLHLERASLYHRLARIEQLLGASLSDDDTMLGVHLALRVLPYLDLTV